MKPISVVTGCYNEEDNIGPFYERLQKVFVTMPQYRFEIIFIDNCSTDKTVEKLRALASTDKNVKVILNTRNFGATRSGYHVLMQGYGDAVILMAADLQDPPELLPQLLEKWEEGNKVVVATKVKSEENRIIYTLRTMYYKLLNSIASVELVEHFTGFGLYDQSVLRELRKLGDTYPYLRGLISELGFKPARVSFVQPLRLHGRSHMNWYIMYDLAMLGLTSHSLVPMRLATFTGFTLAAISLAVALFYFVYKLIYWTSFAVGVAPLIIGIFGLFSMQLIFVGMLGEYIGATHRQILRRPICVERERINFDPTEPIVSPPMQTEPNLQTIVNE